MYRPLAQPERPVNAVNTRRHSDFPTQAKGSLSRADDGKSRLATGNCNV